MEMTNNSQHHLELGLFKLSQRSLSHHNSPLKHNQPNNNLQLMLIQLQLTSSNNNNNQMEIKTTTIMTAETSQAIMETQDLAVIKLESHD